MENIVPQNIAQSQFDFDSLAFLPVPDNTEIGLEITLLPETQEYWWSELEYRHIPRKPGIYAIANTLNGHFYIGSAVSLYSRKCEHFEDLRKCKHANHYLQNAYNRYGVDAFRFVIVEYVKVVESIIEREQYYIDIMNPEYNILRIAGSALGHKHSEETRQKMSEAQKGHVVSETTREKISEAHKGKKRGPLSEKTKGRLSEAKKGKPKSEGHKAKLSEALKGHPAHNKGKPASEAQKAKQSEAMKGKPAPNRGKPHSEKTRKKISEANKGHSHPQSEETRERISKANKGKKKSPEEIARRTATRKAKREAKLLEQQNQSTQ